MGLDLKGLANSLNGDDIAKAASAAADKLPVPDAIKGEVKKAATKENIEKVATKENIDKAKGLANDILGMVSGKDKK